MKTMKVTTSDRTDFRVMTTTSTLDAFGTRVFNATYRCVYRMTAKFAFMRDDQKNDLASDIMMKACLARDSFDESKSSVETWVNTIAWRTIDDWQKKWQHNGALVDSYDETSDIDNDDAYGSSYGEDWRCFKSSPDLYKDWYADSDIEHKEALEEIESALGSLSESDRELAGMLADEVDAKEMADRLGINENALYGRVHKMRKRMTRELGMAA